MDIVTPAVDIRQASSYLVDMNKVTAAAYYARDRVNGLRRLRGWTWITVAERSGVPLNRLYNISAHRGSPMTIDELVKLADAFSVAPSALLPMPTDEDVKVNTVAFLELLTTTINKLDSEVGDGHGRQ